MRNMTIKSWVIKQKRWSEYLTQAPSGKYIQALLRYDLTSTLLAIAWWSLYKAVQSGSRTLIWLVGWYSTWQYTMFSHGDFVLILSWQTDMYIYHDIYWLYQQWTWWFNNSATVLPPPMNDGVSSIVPAYPLIWATITWFTLVAWNNSVTRKILYISKPVVPSAPWRCYDFAVSTQDYDVWENRYMSSNILAIAPAGENVYIFCRETIEIMGRWTAETTSSVVTLSTQIIAKWDQIISRNAFATVDDMVFFWTKDNKIKTINYQPGITNPMIGTISDDIQERIEMNVKSWTARHEYAYAIYNKEMQSVEFHFTSTEWTTYPDKIIHRDLVSKSWYTSDDIAFHRICYGPQERDVMYCASNSDMYKIGAWFDITFQWRRRNSNLDYITIESQYNTPNISLWTMEEKLFRWFMITWGIDQNCKMTIDCYIDWTLVLTETIIDNDIPTAQKLAVNTWDPVTYANSTKYYPFSYVADQWMLRIKWKRIRIQITCTTDTDTYCKFYLDWLRIDAVATWEYELSDKF